MKRKLKTAALFGSISTLGYIALVFIITAGCHCTPSINLGLLELPDWLLILIGMALGPGFLWSGLSIMIRETEGNIYPGSSPKQQNYLIDHPIKGPFLIYIVRNPTLFNYMMMLPAVYFFIWITFGIMQKIKQEPTEVRYRLTKR